MQRVVAEPLALPGGNQAQPRRAAIPAPVDPVVYQAPVAPVPLKVPLPAPVVVAAPAPVPPAPGPRAPRAKAAGRPVVNGGLTAADIPPRGPVAPVQEVAAVPRSVNPMQIFKQAGFATVGTDSGPALQKDAGGGCIATVRGDGKSLTLAKRYAVSVTDPSGTVTAEDIVDGAEQVIEWFAGQTSPTMRM